MPMHAQEIEALLRASFPNAEIYVEGDDGIHMAARVVDESFRGKNRVEQQRAVYAALKGRMDSSDGGAAALHALALTTGVPSTPAGLDDTLPRAEPAHQTKGS